MTNKPEAYPSSAQERDAIIAGSLAWLEVPLMQMFARLRGGNIAEARPEPVNPLDTGVLFNANPSPVQTAPPQPSAAEEVIPDKAVGVLQEKLARKVNAYLMGEEGQYRLTLIDQQDYDILVIELGRYKAEIDAHDTVLGFLEVHLGHLFGRKLTRDSNPYSLHNLAFFVLEGLNDLEISSGIRRGLIRDLLEQIVPDMQSNLWDLANRLEPFAKQTQVAGSAIQPVSAHSPGSHYRGESRSEYQGFHPGGPYSPAQTEFGSGYAPSLTQSDGGKVEKAPHRLLEQLLGALDSFDRYAALSTSAISTVKPTPQVLARWASAAPDQTENVTLQGVRAAGLMQHLPGVDSAQAAVLGALSPVVMKTVVENPALLDDPRHPLRILLNRATEIVAAGTGSKETDQLRQWAESAGRGLLQQPTDTQRWLAELDKLGAGALLRRQERVLDLQLEMEGWHRMLRARQRSDETLTRALTGKRLPREAAAFCDGLWRHVLAMIALRHNPGTQVWLDAQNIINDFSQPSLTDERLDQVKQVVSREISSFFSTTEPDVALPPWLNQLSEPVLAKSSMSWVNQAKPLVTHYTHPIEAVNLELGTWVRFADKTEWPYPLQLVWTSLPYGWFGFVDAAGQRSFKMEKSELIGHVERSRVEQFGQTAFDKLPALMDLNIESWAYEDQLLSTLRDHDTGFLNRRGLIQSLIASSALSNEERWQATVIDFPNLAGCYASGQQAGDKALAGVARMLRGLSRPGLMISRIADARFVLASPVPGEALARETQALATTSQETTGGLRFAIGCCPEAPPGEEMLRFAEQACTTAWEEGSQQVRVSSFLLAQSEDWMRAVSRVMAENRLVLFVQPMRPMRTDMPGHGEVLLRIKSDEEGYVSPAIFLREAERQKLITQVDHWVLREVCSWLTQHELPEGVDSLSVNLSGQTLSDPDSRQELQDILDKSGVQPERLIFEVTETIAVLDPVETRQFLSQVRDRGCRTALDDFGTGYANYSYLRQMPFDYLKIDGSFICELMQNDSDKALVKSMCDVARGLGISSIAEFVHDEAMFPVLMELGVDYAQGYAVSKPVVLSSLFDRPAAAMGLQKLALSST
jgi:EAL domain-containing protein (putative c-di-GMP-specific phosphodiesterase class I)/GGDEF domain-containing protein